MSAGFASERTVTAKKEHQCGECWRTIDKGETYERLAGKWEGDFWDMKSCTHCSAFRKIIDAVDNDFWEGAYGGIHAWVDDIGSSPAELAYWHSKGKYSALSLYRWSTWFGGQWRNHDGDLRAVPQLEAKP